MPRAGGPADKAGNSYERWWTARCCLELLQDPAGRLCVEPLGQEGDGIELWRVHKGRTEAHQVKRQNGINGRWSLPDLFANGVLPKLWLQIHVYDRDVVFVSADGVKGLRELCERARSHTELSVFEADIQSNTELVDHFEALSAVRHFAGTAASRETVHQALRRTTVVTLDDKSLRGSVDERARELLGCEGNELVEAVDRALSDVYGEELRTRDLWDRLAGQGLRRRPDRDPADLHGKLDERAQAQLCRLRGLPCGATSDRRHQIPRAVLADVMTRLDGPTRSLWVTGKGGAGKSTLALDLLAQARQRRWPALLTSAADWGSAQTPEELGQALGLPSTPPRTLDTAAGAGPSVLIIDQIDEIEPPESPRQLARTLLLRLLHVARELRELRVVLLAREPDPEINSVLVLDGAAEVVTLDLLTPTELDAACAAIGVASPRPGSDLHDLLRLPLYLRLYASMPEATRDLEAAATSRSLLQGYVRHVREDTGARGQGGTWERLMGELLGSMARTDQLAVPRANVRGDGALLDRLLRAGFLVEDAAEPGHHGSRIRFMHPVLHDHLRAEAIDDNMDVAEWITGQAAWKIRPGVLRMLLARRAEEQPSAAKLLHALLRTEGLTLTKLQRALDACFDVHVPDAGASREIDAFIARADVAALEIVLQVADRWPRWQEALIAPTLRRAIDAPDTLASSGAWLRRAARRFPERLTTLVDAPEPDLQSAPGVVELVAQSHPSPLCIQALPQLIAGHILSGHIDRRWAWRCVADAKAHEPPANPARIIPIVRALLHAPPGIADTSTLRQLDLRWLATAAPLGFVDAVLDPVVRALHPHPINSSTLSLLAALASQNDGTGPAGTALLRPLAAAIGALLGDGDPLGRSAVDRLDAIQALGPTLLVAEAWAQAGPGAAAAAADWLRAAPDRLIATPPLGPRDPVRQVVELIGEAAPDDVLHPLLDCILCMRPGLEADRSLAEADPKERLAKRRAWADGIGRRQRRLLEAIPAPRRTEQAGARLAALLPRHGPSPRIEPAHLGPVAIGPPSRGVRFDRLSNADWLRLIQKHHHPGGYTPDPRGGFGMTGGWLAAQLTGAARGDPDRFAAFGAALPTGTPAFYISALMSGIGEGSVSPHLRDRLVERQLSNNSLDADDLKAALSFMEATPDHPWDAQTLHRVLRLAQTPSDGTGQGLNSEQGKAVVVVAALLDAPQRGASRAELLRPSVLAAASDPAPPVRAWASWAARALARHDPEAACVAAESLLDAGGPPLGYQAFGRLLDALWPTHGDALEPRIRAALSVTDPAHAQMLVRALCHDQLTRCSSYSQAPPIDRDQPLHRRFAAGATREWIGHPRHGGLARRQLIDFFADPDPEARREANPFWDPEHDGPSPLRPEHHELHLAFARSPACADAPLGILRALKQDPAPDADLVLAVSTSLLRRIQSQGDDVRLTELAFHAYDLAELLSRLARDPTADFAHREKATADIEALLQAPVPGVAELWRAPR